MIKLEAGKTYELNDGSVYKCEERNGLFFLDGCRYAEDGTFDGGCY